jgi:hypothetical protein
MFDCSKFGSGPAEVGLAVSDRPDTDLDLGLERNGDGDFGDEVGDDDDEGSSTLKVSA